MEDKKDKQAAAEQLKAEMDKWHAKLDDARVQLDLAAMDGREKLQPHVDKLQMEWDEASSKMKELQASSGDAWQDIHHGLKISLKAMQQAFSKAEKHFDKEE